MGNTPTTPVQTLEQARADLAVLIDAAHNIKTQEVRDRLKVALHNTFDLIKHHL